MNRLTRKHRHNSYTIYTEIRNADLNKAIEKLGKLEDIEEELGCPLEVVFKALDEGVCVNVEFFDTIERPRLYYSDDKKCYCFELLFGVHDAVKLKDYQKTWWLKGEKQNA